MAFDEYECLPQINASLLVGQIIKNGKIWHTILGKSKYFPACIWYIMLKHIRTHLTRSYLMNRLCATTRSCHRVLMRQREEEKKLSKILEYHFHNLSFAPHIFYVAATLCCCYTPSRLCHTTRHQLACYTNLYMRQCVRDVLLYFCWHSTFFFLLCVIMDGGDGGCCCWASFCPVSAYGTVCINTVRLQGHFILNTRALENILKYLKSIAPGFSNAAIEIYYA